jgi:hypothetical protein
MSPVLSRPLELGADIVMHSATKFIAGHSDLMAGILAVKGERCALNSSFNDYIDSFAISPFHLSHFMSISCSILCWCLVANSTSVLTTLLFYFS